jgi:Na+/H+-dicarboxylate symporter
MHRWWIINFVVGEEEQPYQINLLGPVVGVPLGLAGGLVGYFIGSGAGADIVTLGIAGFFMLLPVAVAHSVFSEMICWHGIAAICGSARSMTRACWQFRPACESSGYSGLTSVTVMGRRFLPSARRTSSQKGVATTARTTSQGITAITTSTSALPTRSRASIDPSNVRPMLVPKEGEAGGT